MAAKRKQKPKLEDKEQSQKFVETARQLGADKNEDAFSRVVGKLITPKKKRLS